MEKRSALHGPGRAIRRRRRRGGPCSSIPADVSKIVGIFSELIGRKDAVIVDAVEAHAIDDELAVAMSDPKRGVCAERIRGSDGQKRFARIINGVWPMSGPEAITFGGEQNDHRSDAHLFALGCDKNLRRRAEGALA